MIVLNIIYLEMEEVWSVTRFTQDTFSSMSSGMKTHFFFNKNRCQMLTKVHRFHFVCCWPHLRYKFFCKIISKLAN
jgi:hypothetical protein